MILTIFKEIAYIYGIPMARLCSRFTKPSAERIAKFIKNNSDKSSIVLFRNDKAVLDINSDRLMPLASTVKIIVAIEYANQAAAGKIDTTEQVDVAELYKYYIRNSDGHAHPGWLAAMRAKGLIVNRKVSLEEVAKGMIRFSSNANTEYLMDKLGLDNINSNLDKLGLKQHQKLYPIVSSLFIGKGKSKKQLIKMSQEEYSEAALKIHKELKSGLSPFKKRRFYLFFYSQKIWSDRLTSSTTGEYASIVKKINDRTYFDAATQQHLDTLMEVYFEQPKNRESFIHAGTKGGSTLFVLTKAVYATDRNGNKTELVYFLNNMAPWQTIFLRASTGVFERDILMSLDSMDKLVKVITGK